MGDARLLQEHEMATELHIELKELRRLRRAKRIPHIMISRKAYYSPKWVDSWIDTAHKLTIEELCGTTSSTTRQTKTLRKLTKNPTHVHQSQVTRGPKQAPLEVFREEQVR